MGLIIHFGYGFSFLKLLDTVFMGLCLSVDHLLHIDLWGYGNWNKLSNMLYIFFHSCSSEDQYIIISYISLNSSQSDIYAALTEQKFEYCHAFLHRTPRLSERRLSTASRVAALLWSWSICWANSTWPMLETAGKDTGPRAGPHCEAARRIAFHCGER